MKRFPVEIAAALVGVIAAMRMAFLQHHQWLDDNSEWYLRTILASILVMNVSLTLTLTCEAGKISSAIRWALLGLVGGLLTWFVFELSTAEWSMQLYTASFLFVHACVALSAVWNRTRRGYWEFNKTLFLRLLTGALFTGVLTIGISLALAALEELFDVDVQGWMYAWNVIFLVGMFNTLFVLGGIPETPSTNADPTNIIDQQSDSYPRGLRIFTQFVLLPLIVVFLCILYAYGIKVLFFTELNGNVSAFILMLAIVGTLAFLLVYPLRNDADHNWISLYSRWFGRIMIPLSVMLWVAIIVRVNAYGITEGRYAVIALASCLTLISLYLAVLRDPDLRVIPTILAIASLVAFVGPINMTSVSYRSQTARANALLDKYHIVVNRQIDTVASLRLTKEDAATLRSVVYYLHSYEDSSRVQRWLSDVTDAAPPSLDDDTVVKWLNIPSSTANFTADANEWVKLNVDHSNAPQNQWIDRGSVQPFLIDVYVSDTTNHTFTFYDEGAWVVKFPADTLLQWIVSDPNGASDTIDFRNVLSDANDEKGPSHQRGSVTRVAEFPHRKVTFAFISFEATLRKHAWKYIDARGIITIERK